MLSYPIDEAESLLSSKLQAAKLSLSNCEEDLDFLREQITVLPSYLQELRGISLTAATDRPWRLQWLGYTTGTSYRSGKKRRKKKRGKARAPRAAPRAECILDEMHSNQSWRPNAQRDAPIQNRSHQSPSRGLLRRLRDPNGCTRSKAIEFLIPHQCRFLLNGMFKSKSGMDGLLQAPVKDPACTRQALKECGTEDGAYVCTAAVTELP